MTQLTPRKLTAQDALDLAGRLRLQDLADLTLHAEDPFKALRHAVDAPGEAYCIWDGDVRIGAGGWTDAGVVWSLWADLTPAQSRELLRMAVPWARIMAIRANRPLHNFFLASNSQTQRWLELTRCVKILYSRFETWQGRAYVPFLLKSIEEMPRV